MRNNCLIKSLDFVFAEFKGKRMYVFKCKSSKEGMETDCNLNEPKIKKQKEKISLERKRFD